MKKFFLKELNLRIHSTAIVALRMNGDSKFHKTKNRQSQNYKGAGVNSKGAVSILLVMAILAAILAISLGTSFVTSSEIRMSSSSSESITAYYAAETGIEQALYEEVKLGRVPRGNRCAGNCPNPACGWTCTENVLGPSEPYCLDIIVKDEGSACVLDDIVSIRSIGEYKTTRRSIEISF